MDNCEEVKFYSPKDTFGGVYKQAKCDPVSVKVPKELKEPYDVVEGQIIYTPADINVYNDEQKVECPAGTVEHDKSSITIYAATLSDTVKLQEVTSIADDVLYYIAKNKLENTIETFLKDKTLEQDVVDEATGYSNLQKFLNVTKLNRTQALEFITLARRKQDTLNKQALLMVQSQLDCYYKNNPVTAICPNLIEEDLSEEELSQAKRDLLEYASNAKTVTRVTIPYGVVISRISQDDADNLARQMALSRLICYFENDAITVDCRDDDRPNKPIELEDLDGEIEKVKTYTDGAWIDYLIETNNLQNNVNRPVGMYRVPKGTFQSYESKADANKMAKDYAYTLLNCIYLNDAYQTTCADILAFPEDADEARFLGESPSKPKFIATAPDKGQVVNVPAGYVYSELSTNDANEQVKALASTLLECCFVNPRIVSQCPIFIEKDSSGRETGKTIPASYLQDPEQEALVVIPEGMFTSCTSKQETIDMANAYLATMLEECYYCNEIVPPSCVPQWVKDASTLLNGVKVQTSFRDNYGVVYNEGDNYILPLPIDYTNIYNPFTGEKEDVSQWSVDATLGYPANTMCVRIDEIPSLDDIIQTITPTLKSEKEICTYTNDLVVAGCKLEDPYKNTDKVHIFITKFDHEDDTACISDHLSYPASGSYVEVPEGTFVVSEYDIPRTATTHVIDGEVITVHYPPLPGEPGYNSSAAISLVKQYANEQAIALAESMLECVFSNPETIVTCDGTEDAELCGDSWEFVANTGISTSRPFHESSNTTANPIVIPADTFTSYESKLDVYNQTYAFGMSLVQCLYGNEKKECDCIQLGRPHDNNHTVVIPKNTFIGKDPTLLDKQAQDMACQLVVCFEINSSANVGPMGPQGPQGPAGPAGPAGACTNMCHGVYT